MKIGILTYHRAENYGALLQAYAMRTYLQSLGHDVEFVDYWPKYHSDYFKVFSMDSFEKSSLKGKLAKLARLMLVGHKLRQRKRVMLEFIHGRLGLPVQPKYEDRKSVTEPYDAVIYGSDQIWRKQGLGGVDFDDWYFGSDNVQAKKKIVYAGSMGKIATNAQDDAYVKEQMVHFGQISVREDDLLEYLKGLGVNSVRACDPVFLLSRKQWEEISVAPKIKQQHYILFYNLLNTKESAAFAKKLSAETGLPVYEITKKTSLFSRNAHLISKASVGEFLGLVRGADYVVSNSFHGVAFSIIFEKQFYAVGMGEKANRVVSLLNSLGLDDRYQNASQPGFNLSLIDYDAPKQMLETAVEESRGYLKEALK